MVEQERNILGLRATPGMASAAVRAAALWIALGAVTKLLWGTPVDLPETLHGFMVNEPAGFLALVIGIELLVAIAACISPRTGWLAVAGVLAVFTVIAGFEMARGTEACGCFGEAIVVPPWVAG